MIVYPITRDQAGAMSKLKALLLHPDPEVRSQLRDMLSPVKEIAVLGEAVSSFEALEMLTFIPYDVFFMGTDLPHGVSGMELAAHLAQGDDPPALIFLATEEDQAFTAFELGAADYLLWPANANRFARSIERLRPLLPRKRPRLRPSPCSHGSRSAKRPCNCPWATTKKRSLSTPCARPGT